MLASVATTRFAEGRVEGKKKKNLSTRLDQAAPVKNFIKLMGSRTLLFAARLGRNFNG